MLEINPVGVFFCFKRYLVSDFIASNYESRVLIDPC